MNILKWIANLISPECRVNSDCCPKKQCKDRACVEIPISDKQLIYTADSGVVECNKSSICDINLSYGTSADFSNRKPIQELKEVFIIEDGKDKLPLLSSHSVEDKISKVKYFSKNCDENIGIIVDIESVLVNGERYNKVTYVISLDINPVVYYYKGGDETNKMKQFIIAKEYKLNN